MQAASSRTNDSARCWRTSRRARSRGLRAVRRARRAGKDRLIGTCSRSADWPRRRIMTRAASLTQARRMSPHDALAREQRLGEDQWRRPRGWGYAPSRPHLRTAARSVISTLRRKRHFWIGMTDNAPYRTRQAATQRAAATPRTIRTGRGAPPSAMAMGFLQIWAPGQGRSRDSGGETRGPDFGELPDTLGRPGRAFRRATTRRKPNHVPQNVWKTRSPV
jgi:hypothetical protein